MRVEVLVPWQPGCRHRHAALHWVTRRYAAQHPSWTFTPAIAAGRLDQWAKGAIVNPAIRASTADVLVVADADVWTDGLPAAVDEVLAGAPWAVPHQLVRRLSEEATAELLDVDATVELPDPSRLQLAERPYRGKFGGGIVIARRDTLLEVPLDPRFTGWGQEDVSWGVALHVLAGPCWRGDTDLIHLWHPPQRRDKRKVGSLAGQLLGRRYLAARRDPARMRALLQEIPS